MKNLAFSTLLALSLVVLTGCFATPLQRSQLTMVKKGIAINDIKTYVGKSDIEQSFEFSTEEMDYLVQAYSLQTGTTQSMTMVCTPTCIPVNTTVPVVAPYVFIFDKPSKHLVSWGLIEELSKNPDEKINKLMPPLKVAMEAIKSKKKKSKN